jgi:hypothetical protein
MPLVLSPKHKSGARCSIISGPSHGGNCCGQCFLENILKVVSSYTFEFFMYKLFLVVIVHCLLETEGVLKGKSTVPGGPLQLFSAS